VIFVERSLCARTRSGKQPEKRTARAALSVQNPVQNLENCSRAAKSAQNSLLTERIVKHSRLLPTTTTKRGEQMKVQSTKQVGHDSLKFLIAGVSGAGKTTLAGTTGEPTIVISAEAGLLSLAGKEIDFVDLSHDDDGAFIAPAKRFDRLRDVFKFLNSDEARAKYKWVIIDSLTEIGQLLMEKLQVKYPDRKEALVMWGEFGNESRSMIKAFRDLRGFNVVFTALVQQDKDENGRRIWSLMYQSKISDHMPAFFDEVFFYTTQEDPEGNTRRVLVTSNSDKFPAKDRSGKLDQFEPPSLKHIADKIRG
jgi:hypothetical protein